MCRMTLLAATVLSLVITTEVSANPFRFGRSPPAAPPAAGQTAQARAPQTQPQQPQQPGVQTAQAPAPAPRATALQRLEVERLDPLARAAFWSIEVEGDPREAEAGVRLSHALRDMGRFQEAAASAERVLVVTPAQQDALLELGRARIGQGQGFYAIEPLQRAAAQAPNDYRPVSLLAIAYEQVQRDDEALAAHRQAMAMAPSNPGVVVNLALFFAGHGDTTQAEQLLRRAVAMPGATAQARQNLALILGLQGRIDEAERLARQDLPPELVANNVAYLRAAGTPTGARSWNSVASSQTP